MRDVADILEDDEVTKFSEYSFKRLIELHPEDYSFCPTPGCDYIFLWDKDSDSNDFTCPHCEKHYCLNCRCDFHTGISCEQYKKVMNVSAVRCNN